MCSDDAMIGWLTPPAPPLPLWLFLTRAQERDLLRAFRARLFDVQSELEKEKNKSDDGASAWIEKVGTALGTHYAVRCAVSGR